MDRINYSFNSSLYSQMSKKFRYLFFISMGGLLLIQACSKKDTTTDYVCDPSTSFITTIKPILDKNCNTSGCHDDITITALNNFQMVHDGAAQIKISIQAGRMPKGGKLSTTDRNTLFCWIDNGAKNN